MTVIDFMKKNWMLIAAVAVVIVAVVLIATSRKKTERYHDYERTWSRGGCSSCTKGGANDYYGLLDHEEDNDSVGSVSWDGVESFEDGPNDGVDEVQSAETNNIRQMAAAIGVTDNEQMTTKQVSQTEFIEDIAQDARMLGQNSDGETTYESLDFPIHDKIWTSSTNNAGDEIDVVEMGDFEDGHMDEVFAVL
jgi:hypothetical protein